MDDHKQVRRAVRVEAYSEVVARLQSAGLHGARLDDALDAVNRLVAVYAETVGGEVVRLLEADNG